MEKSVDFQRLVIRGDILLDEAFHLGSGQASEITDMAIQRDWQGIPYIPGSSLAGLLRSAAEDLVLYMTGKAGCFDHNGRPETCPVCRLFGYVPADTENHLATAYASRIYVEDACTPVPLVSLAEVREHVGISRTHGSAQGQLQYDNEVAPGGMSLGFEMSIEDPVPDDLRLILAIITLWQSSGFQVGGKTTSGLGWARLNNITYFALDFKQKDLLREYLLPAESLDDEREKLPPQAKRERKQLEEYCKREESGNINHSREDHFLPQQVVVDLALMPLEPLLIASDVPDPQAPIISDADFVQTTRADGSRVYYLPGSSLKGILRTRAEKIIRTLDYFFAAQNEQVYRQHISACAITHCTEVNNPLLSACFGFPSWQRKAEKEGWDADRIYRDSCLACRMFGNSMMRGRLSVGEGKLISSQSALKRMDQVAIDRFSGGAADAKKFDNRPMVPIDRSPLFKLQIKLERVEPWMLGLLLLLMKDLQDGDIYVGHATHSGFGRIKGKINRIDMLLLEGSKMTDLAKKYNFASNPFLPYFSYNLMLPDLSTALKEKDFWSECHQALLEQIKGLDVSHRQQMITGEIK
jgi:CRISPR/Cas system CSM-associated protein Csm3 (group 7 of RAMP superfamily)